MPKPKTIVLAIRIAYLLCGIGFLTGMFTLTFILPNNLLSDILRWIIATFGMFALWNAFKKQKPKQEY